MPTLQIMGAHFRPPAKAILQSLPSDQTLELRPEPSNPYDPNAVGVWIDAAGIPQEALEELSSTLPGQGCDVETLLEQGWWHLGYIPKEKAADLQTPIGLAIDANNSAAEDEYQIWSGYPAHLTFTGDGKPAVTFNL